MSNIVKSVKSMLILIVLLFSHFLCTQLQYTQQIHAAA